MAAIKPPPGFENSPLDIETVRAGRRFGRIYASAFPDPLGYGKTPSRFSDPRRRDPAGRFGVVYLGDTLKVCFLEAVLRDRRDGLMGDLPIDEKEIYARRYAEIDKRINSTRTPPVTVALRTADVSVLENLIQVQQ
ncbi:RES domain-containing protein [Sinorhizobium meliloti]|uniref:RES domain-containing protein n=1 Tax=Rhizobium meliloti TaxID=382 RepID=UPI000FDB5786|nr:RES domain-containing protein [Sinorhizobium meliloti]RVH34186.1 RES domain-containing protein [Sinorhizobium meliloti]